MSAPLPAKGPLRSRNLGVLAVSMKESGRYEKAKRNLDHFPSKKAGWRPGTKNANFTNFGKNVTNLQPTAYRKQESL